MDLTCLCLLSQFQSAAPSCLESLCPLLDLLAAQALQSRECASGEWPFLCLLLSAFFLFFAVGHVEDRAAVPAPDFTPTTPMNASLFCFWQFDSGYSIPVLIFMIYVDIIYKIMQCLDQAPPVPSPQHLLPAPDLFLDRPDRRPQPCRAWQVSLLRLRAWEPL